MCHSGTESSEFTEFRSQRRTVVTQSRPQGEIQIWTTWSARPGDLEVCHSTLYIASQTACAGLVIEKYKGDYV